MSENVFKQYDSIDLARHIMAVCDENNIIFEKNNGNTKLNKLLYIVYGVYLSIYNKSILTEKPKCFPYGPVFPRVFKKYIKLESQKLNLEKNLESILSTIKGVGEVNVFINYSESNQVVAMYDETTTTSSTEETDSAGGKRDTTSTETQKAVVYSDENGTKNPVTEKIIMFACFKSKKIV